MEPICVGSERYPSIRNPCPILVVVPGLLMASNWLSPTRTSSIRFPWNEHPGDAYIENGTAFQPGIVCPHPSTSDPACANSTPDLPAQVKTILFLRRKRNL